MDAWLSYLYQYTELSNFTNIKEFKMFIFQSYGVLSNELTKICQKIFNLFLQKNEFVQFAKVNPLTLLLSWKVEPGLYMTVVGVVEVVGAVLLCLGVQSLEILASVVLIVTMVGAIQTLYWLNAVPQMFLPATVCLVLLLCNLSFMRKQEVHPKAD